VSGHDFSRADKANKKIWSFSPCQTALFSSARTPTHPKICASLATQFLLLERYSKQRNQVAAQPNIVHLFQHVRVKEKMLPGRPLQSAADISC
jgi:hypothetical protein